MSVGAQVAVLGGGRAAVPAPAAAGGSRRPALLSAVAFGMLGVYGALRWETMLASPPLGRMLGLVGLALAIVALGVPARRGPAAARAAAVAGTMLVALAMIPMAGLPLGWAVHLRIAVSARWIGNGLSALPGVVVPYRGGVPNVRAVISLGAAMLLLGGALTLAATRPPRGRARLAASAVPLIVLATVPAALARPHVAYLHGALLFALVALLVFSERIRLRRAIGVTSAVGAAALAAIVLAPVFDTGHPWIRFVTLTGTGGPGRIEAFDWSQRYTPLPWPRTGNTMIAVRARFPAYWKAEDLDMFDGRGWATGPVDSGNPLAGVSAATRSRWTETVTVAIRGMRTTQLIAAGTAESASLPPGTGLIAGDAPGTWRTETPLQAGDTYQVRVYAPDPSPRELAGAGEGYPAAVALSELQLNLPVTTGATTATMGEFHFAPYGAAQRVEYAAGITSGDPAQALAQSPYAPAVALAERLAAGTTTPYGYTLAVLRYLSHGFTYSQTPPRSSLPLLTFLFGDHVGYCQQFAGAMALLLRMGGVPARVAAGFTPGTYSSTAHAFVVSDLDAHAWVEAWFPAYGWVRFDPTPASDPALGGRSIPATPIRIPSLPSHPATPPPAAHPHAVSTGGRGARAAGQASGPWPWLGAGLGGLLLVVSVGWWMRRRTPPTPAMLLAELERAFERCGRPLPGGVTLAALERRLADAPAAAEYVQMLARTRYAGATELPGADGRRALRRRLGAGLGVGGRLRALLALPPRPGWTRPGGRRLH